MESISIVPYRPELAAAVADMWNGSRDSWGGGSSITTAEQIRQEEASSDALAVYLAMDRDLAVGYCSLSEYREDTGALYIPLLNVRPEYHGKKVGRMLLARVLEQTIQLGWPRLDLYTWAGNTKAVPLYKKFGFFWEDRDDSTHLMNMIPTVLRTEAIAHYFEELDWYRDSTREIAVEPDGRKENGFDYFTYSWAKGDRSLRVEFERRGRGMRLIETEDYLLSAEAEKLELVFGREYRIHYRIVNKSGKPLQVALKGASDGTIRFDYEQELEVTGETTLSAAFFVDEIAEEQSVWRTHPRVCTHLLINGKAAIFQVGVLPKFPASLALHVPGVTYPGQKAEFYLDVENNFAEEAEFSFELPSPSFLQLHEQHHTLRLRGKERISLPLGAVLHEHGFYEANVQMEAKLADGGSVSFAKKIGAAFTGFGAMLSGETEQNWQVHHGRHKLYLNKDDNEIKVTCGTSGNPTTLIYPKIGKPYSSEFSKKRAEQVEFIAERGAIGIRVAYRSGEYPPIALTGKTLLFGDGTVEHGYEAENLSADKTAAELWLSQGVAHNLQRPILPYQGRYVEVPASCGSDLDYWDGELFSENWLFSRDKTAPWGMCWPEEYRIEIQSWYIALETSFGVLEPHGKTTFGPIYLTLGSYNDWKSFRAFARREAIPAADLSLSADLELIANGHNPFVGSGEINVQVQEHKQQYLDGELTASLKNDPSSERARHHMEEEEETESRFSFITPERSYELLQVDGLFAAHETRLLSAVFPIGQGKVTRELSEEEGQQVYIADNGRLRIKAAPDFYPTLYSLTSHGQEWLASSFPNRQPKSWWNPWAGGMGNQIAELSAFSLVKEERSASFVELVDNRQNVWQGIKLSYRVNKQEKYRGLTCHQYYLLLPGVPVLCHTVEIVQNTGTYFAGKNWSTDIFLQTGDAGEEVWLKTVGTNGELRYKLAQGELSVTEASIYRAGSAARKDQMQIVTDLDTAVPYAYSNKEVAVVTFERELHLPNNSMTFTSPVFFLFADEPIPSESLSALRAIRFTSQRRTQDENH
ncbi:GNAT family N-acetyltransferase [Paenibacillus spongiae]|uniref:GNAT family N-acetyltransferase n=1 Tax=Paenibacillus spongiae TaxID=2909671 RepID=A0ABY5S6G1_9BACL|nr:GNAT family N-acetyltransferase [Paenibacillus spongiae]UVI28437.1 GNAT family N-acetyltransferase [Paenibacillus spongiae]